jgi:DNA invertase Pin-like site-specific DNA recombinase
MESRLKMTAGYCRAGTPNREQIGRQKRLLKGVAKEHHLRIGKFYIDNGQCGGTLERPGFEELLRDCKAGKISVVLVDTTNRLARTHYLFIDALCAFSRYKVQLLVNDTDGFKFLRIALKPLTQFHNNVMS